MIGFNTDVAAGEKFGEKFGENRTQDLILEMMSALPTISAEAIAHKLGITSRVVEKNIRAMKKLGYIERVGAAKGRHWVVTRAE
jgi:ATP-dependent DNA helicase RecG